MVQKKVIALIGLLEGVFPRPNRNEPFNLVRTKLGVAPGETDKMLFLEAITLADEALYLSYPISKSDQLPSSAVIELLNYAKKRFGKEILTIEKEPPPEEIPPKFFTFSTSEPKAVEITIEEIRRFAKNPLRRYFQKTLGIHFQDEEASLFPSDESFALDPLTLYGIKEEALANPIESAIASFKAKLPFGPLSQIAATAIHRDLDKEKHNKQLLGITGEAISLILTDTVTEATLEGKTLLLPPLKIHNVTITGELRHVYPEGLLLNLKSDAADLVKGWPEFLIYLKLVEKHSLNFSKTLLCLKSGKKREATVNCLEEYLDHLLTSEHTPSLLLPDFISPLIKMEPEEALEQIHAKIASPYAAKNPYLAFGIDLISLEHTASLKNTAAALFGELFT